jgi:hypothetical protein
MLRRMDGSWRLQVGWLAVVLGTAGGPACSWRVLEDAAATPGCTDDGGCPGGTRCVAGACVTTEPEPIPLEATVVGPEGGLVHGPDGVLVEVAAGAVANTTAFSITMASATLDHTNFAATTRFYTIAPNVAFTAGTTVQVRVPTATPAGGAAPLTLFLQPTPPGPEWAPYPDADGDGVFFVDQTGTFAVGQPVEP